MMRILTHLAAFLVVSCCVHSERAAHGKDRLFGQIDVLFWTLDAPSHDVTIDENSFVPVLGTNQTQPGYGNFPRITAGLQLDDQLAGEFVYFGYDGWSSIASADGDNDLSLPGPVSLATLDFFDADEMVLSSRSQIHNAEFNLRFGSPDECQLLAGFRFLHLDEHLNINSRDIDSGSSDYRINSTSNLFGLQVGADRRWGNSDLYLRTVGKTGVFGGHMRQSTFLGDFNNTVVLRDFQQDGEEVSFLAEIGISAGARLAKHLRVEAGYNLMWIENIARAADQLDFSDFAASGFDLRQHGSAFVHGANLSVIIDY